MASGEEPGQVEIQYADTFETNPVTVWSAHTSGVSAAAKAAPTGATYTGLPYTSAGMIGGLKFCKGRILLKFTADATDIIESEESAVSIPAVVYEDRNGQPGKVIKTFVLTADNMTGFTAAGTVDITATAAVPTRVCYYDVPRGAIVALDPQQKIHIYFGDDS